jgi:hypothetical protein
VLSLTPGSWFIPASNAVLHALLSSAFLSLRQIVISSALGMNALQSLSTSGVHAKRCSGVPCAEDGAGEAVADSRASNTHQCAKDIDRYLFRLSMFISGPAYIIADIDTLLREHCACSEASAFVAFDPRSRPSVSKNGRVEHRAATRGCPVSRFRGQRRVRMNHQIIAGLFKRRERHQR